MDPGQGKDILCAVCHTSVRGTDFVACTTCEVPVHRTCWAYAGHCPAYGCASTAFAEPADLIFRKKVPAVVVDGTADGRQADLQGELELDRKSVRYLALDAQRQNLTRALMELRSEREARRSRVFWMMVGGTLLALWVLGSTGIDMVGDPAFLVGFFAFAGAAGHAWGRDAVAGLDTRIVGIENEVRQLDRSMDSIKLVGDGREPVRELPRRIY